MRVIQMLCWHSMKQEISVIESFISTLKEKGHSGEIVWLQESQMILTKTELNIFIPMKSISSLEVATVYENNGERFECGATLMLVAVANGKNFCTLLMDSFGSDSEIEVVKGKLYFYCIPYANNVKLTTSKLSWFFLKYFVLTKAISSLDYAFRAK